MRNIKSLLSLTFAFVFLALVCIVPRFAHATATITVINLDGPGEGFNDLSLPDPDSTAGGNTGLSLGEQRLIAFQFAANIWGNILDSSVEIRVGANFDPLPCSPTFAVLGSCGPNQAFINTPGALETNTLYPAALANKLAGVDLDPLVDDIGATFNSAVGTTCTFPNVWYYGLDGIPPGLKIDFVTVVLHELCHGLGFLTFVDLATGQKFYGYDDVFMLNLEDDSTGMLYPDMTDAERVAASINTGNLHWVGLNVIADSVGLTSGRVAPSGHVEMYAPNPQEPGSSVSHFSTSLSPDERMEPFYTGAGHDVGLASSLLADIGWMGDKPVDLYFIVDLSGSFWDDLPVFKTEAPIIINDLLAEGIDLKVGLGSFVDYPISPFGSDSWGDYAYQQDIDLTSNTAAVESVISGLSTRNGLDTPESQLPALYQAATGAGQNLSILGFPTADISSGQQANFRDGAVKLFLLWTDAPFHYPGDPGDLGSINYPGPSFNDTVNAILALDPPKVIGVSSGADLATRADLEAMATATDALAPEGGIDCDGDGIIDVLEGEPLVCSHAITGAGVGAAMLAVIEAAVKPININIDVRDSINLNSAKIAVKILSTDIFNALDIDPTTVCFGAEPIPGVGDCSESHGKAHIEDTNDDGLLDLVLHYDTNETGLASDDTEAYLTGKTFNGQAVEGCVSISIITPKRTRKSKGK